MTPRPKPRLAYERPPGKVFGSPEFVARTRNPDLPSPERFEPTVKGENDVVI